MAGGPKKKIGAHWYGTAQVEILHTLAKASHDGRSVTIQEITARGYTRKQVTSAFENIGLEVTATDGTKYRLGKAVLKMLDDAGV